MRSSCEGITEPGSTTDGCLLDHEHRSSEKVSRGQLQQHSHSLLRIRLVQQGIDQFGNGSREHWSTHGAEGPQLSVHHQGQIFHEPALNLTTFPRRDRK